MNSSSDNSPNVLISSEQFVALNDEIAALVRAGIPLELGLRTLGEESAGALGRISSRLAERMDGGESISTAIKEEQQHLPQAYAALVDAGLKAGRLPAALEAVSAFTRELIDFRRQLTLAAFYPLIVISLAYGLFLVFLAEFVARYEAAMESARVSLSGLLQVFVALRDSMSAWAWVPPVLLVVVVAWFAISRRRRVGLFGLPFAGVKYFQVAMFADLLAMQLEHSVSLPAAIVLSAEATGSHKLIESAREVSGVVSSGERISAHSESGDAFPPFLRWLMVSGEQQGQLARSLKLAADMYRRRATNSLIWFKTVAPALVLLFVGGGIVLLYALGLFVPFIQLLRGFSAPGI
jgi:general secretion pathway protein F